MLVVPRGTIKRGKGKGDDGAVVFGGVRTPLPFMGAGKTGFHSTKLDMALGTVFLVV
jgi:hypothetical protein